MSVFPETDSVCSAIGLWLQAPETLSRVRGRQAPGRKS